ncbi:hypothetical protein BDK51DRAFT_39975 [Blyttiomyces helicus]|uniref:Uncharacterized protein n=1 Tax=Blyttiomyces helicus TaxID=388810 RepID=A0A4P9VY48_9FUNG|nr:hypothetical protein BDK51DRAFT_39975 [Blyttiomyces helicus]|eukprot:RKO84182.1 hypothetical protein BDK51DRAFT_39975 [Blyttiomyces helicus]
MLGSPSPTASAACAPPSTADRPPAPLAPPTPPPGPRLTTNEGTQKASMLGSPSPTASAAIAPPSTADRPPVPLAPPTPPPGPRLTTNEGAQKGSMLSSSSPTASAARAPPSTAVMPLAPLAPPTAPPSPRLTTSPSLALGSAMVASAWSTPPLSVYTRPRPPPAVSLRQDSPRGSPPSAASASTAPPASTPGSDSLAWVQSVPPSIGSDSLPSGEMWEAEAVQGRRGPITLADVVRTLAEVAAAVARLELRLAGVTSAVARLAGEMADIRRELKEMHKAVSWLGEVAAAHTAKALAEKWGQELVFSNLPYSRNMPTKVVSDLSRLQYRDGVEASLPPDLGEYSASDSRLFLPANSVIDIDLFGKILDPKAAFPVKLLESPLAYPPSALSSSPGPAERPFHGVLIGESSRSTSLPLHPSQWSCPSPQDTLITGSTKVAAKLWQLEKEVVVAGSYYGTSLAVAGAMLLCRGWDSLDSANCDELMKRVLEDPATRGWWPALRALHARGRLAFHGVSSSRL